MSELVRKPGQVVAEGTDAEIREIVARVNGVPTYGVRLPDGRKRVLVDVKPLPAPAPPVGRLGGWPAWRWPLVTGLLGLALVAGLCWVVYLVALAAIAALTAVLPAAVAVVVVVLALSMLVGGSAAGCTVIHIRG